MNNFIYLKFCNYGIRWKLRDQIFGMYFDILGYFSIRHYLSWGCSLGSDNALFVRIMNLLVIHKEIK